MSELRPAVLYLCRNGLLEPLGQSQVLAYLRGLSPRYRVTLITFEKEKDLADRAAMEAMHAHCETHDIRWLPQRFRTGPRGLSQLMDLWIFLRLSMREVRVGNAALIHARSYIPAAVAAITGRLTGVPFIFDMRALWPEELITAGRLRRGSLIHKGIVAAERSCIRRAGAVVSLTQSAAGYLSQEYRTQLSGKAIDVIPTCADLDRFTPGEQPKSAETEPLYGCIGTVLSGWFRMDWLAALYAALAAQTPNARFEVITLDDPDAVQQALAAAGFQSDRLKVYGLAPRDMPEALRQQAASVMVYQGGALSERGRSPTRLAEILGCGVPVFANGGVGDVAEVVTDHKVGVLVTGKDPDAIDTALSQMRNLQADPDLPQRCRTTAQTMFSLQSGVAAYDAIYQRLLGKTKSAKAT